MNKRYTYLILVIFINAVSAILVLGAGAKGKTSLTRRTFVLPDGFMLKSVDGRLTQSFDPAQDGKDSNDIWFFEFDSAVIGSSKVTGLVKLELLPSSMLEKMISDANASSAADYRLSAGVTKYKGRNFLFPTKFLPLSEVNEPPPVEPPPPEAQPSQKEIEEPNDELGIPKEILEKLKTGSSSPSAGRERSGMSVRPVAGKQAQIKQDFILSNRTGFLTRKADGSMVFNLDALGLSAGSTGDTYRLLPCQALELTERLQASEIDHVRFKIAGIVTEYQGEEFLLLHRVIRVYNYGNFSR